MAYSRVTHTSDGIGAIKYAKDGSAHNKDRFVKGRVLYSSSLNCTVNGCKAQMMSVWKHFGIDRATRRKLGKKPRREAQRLIQSFDPKQLDYRNPDDVRTVNQIGQATAKLLYPNQQSIVITQADGIGHKLHNHIITNMVNFKTGKALHGKSTGWRYTAQVTDKITAQFYNHLGQKLNPGRHHDFIKTVNGRTRYASLNPKTSAEYHIKKRGSYSWVADIKARLDKASDVSANWHEYIANCKQLGVDCDPFRKNGKLKKRTSYRFIDKKGKLRRIRSKKLGPIYSPSNLSNAVFPTIRKRRTRSQERNVQALKSTSEASSVSAWTTSSESSLSLPTQTIVPTMAKSLSTSASSSMADVQVKHVDNDMIMANRLAHRHSVNNIMPYMTMNGRRAMTSEIPLVPKMVQLKYKGQVDRTVTKIDKKYQLNNGTKMQKGSWFFAVKLAWQGLKADMRVLKTATHKWYKRAKQWLRQGPSMVPPTPTRTSSSANSANSSVNSFKASSFSPNSVAIKVNARNQQREEREQQDPKKVKADKILEHFKNFVAGGGIDRAINKGVAEDNQIKSEHEKYENNVKNKETISPNRNKRIKELKEYVRKSALHGRKKQKSQQEKYRQNHYPSDGLDFH